MLPETTDKQVSGFWRSCGVAASLLSNQSHTRVMNSADHALAGFAAWWPGAMSARGHSYVSHGTRRALGSFT